MTALVGKQLYEFLYQKDMPKIVMEEEQPNGEADKENEAVEEVEPENEETSQDGESLNGMKDDEDEDEDDEDDEDEDEDGALESDEDNDLVERDSDLESDEEDDLVVENMEDDEDHDETKNEQPEDEENDTAEKVEEGGEGDDDEDEVEDDEDDDDDDDDDDDYLTTNTQDGHLSEKLVPMFPAHSKLPEVQTSGIDPDSDFDEGPQSQFLEGGPEYFNYGFNHASWNMFVDMQKQYRKEHPKAQWSHMNQFDPTGRDVNDSKYKNIANSIKSGGHSRQPSNHHRGDRSPVNHGDYGGRRGRSSGNRTPNRRPPKRQRR